MAYLQLSQGQLSFGDRLIFQEAHIRINSGDRLALAGTNGSGKTTLMKALAGFQELDQGTVTSSKEGDQPARVTYLPQSGIQLKGEGVKELALQAFGFLKDLEVRLEATGEALKDKNQSENRIQQLVEEHHILQERLLNDGYYDRDRRTEEVLIGLGFTPEDLSRKADTFSGGWQMRIALAQVLLSDPEILLLDEPTNYLDLEAREWLLQFLNRYPGGLLMVSHDRYFLDRSINGVMELHQQRLNRYPGNYSSYQTMRAQENIQQAQAYEEQQEEIARIEDFIRRFRYNSSKAALVQSRVKMLEKIERLEPPPGLTTMNLQFPEPPHSGKEVIRMADLSKAYGSLEVIRKLTLTINKGEKLVVAGRNGAGKSTLLRILGGQDHQYEGSVEWGAGVSIGYFSQDHEKELPPELTILEYLEATAPTALIPRLRDMLGALLFRGDEVYKKLGVLSGGEKSRISLLKLLLEPHNLLILDEPTNHLDIHSKDILLEALSRYPGTIIFVSHDRYFIEGLATRVLELSPKEHRIFPGDYGYYLHRRKQEENDEILENESKPLSTEETLTEGKASHQEDKRLRNLIRKKERLIEELTKQQEATQGRLKEQEENLTRPDIYSHPEKARETQRAIEELKHRLEQQEEEWLVHEEELEKLLQEA